jgi:hypothetical protein
MAAGDRILNPEGDGYATHEITDETIVGGRKQAAMLVKQVDDTGATVTPAAGGATEAKQDAEAVLIGAVNETAPATDTASSGLNGRLQRIAQHFTTFITAFLARIPAALSSGGGVKVGVVDGATQDGGASWTAVWGVSNAPVSSADMSAADADLTAAPTGGQKWVITDVFVSADTAMRIDIKEETSGTVMFSGYVSANSGFQQLCPRSKRKLAVADKKVVGRTSAAGNVRILVGAYSEA